MISFIDSIYFSLTLVSKRELTGECLHTGDIKIAAIQDLLSNSLLVFRWVLD